MKNKQKNTFPYLNVVGQTDVGRKRKLNEDRGRHFECINGYVAVVCDGMGGHVGGAIASTIAVDTIQRFLSDKYYKNPTEAISLAIQAANEAILLRQDSEPNLRGMGSTCVLLIVRDGKVYIGHVGDSRIYIYRENTLKQLTKDHSYVQMLVDAGEISQEDADHHPRKNEITNALGVPDMALPTVSYEPIVPHAGDCFLLCSDGLSVMVSGENICEIIGMQREYGTQQRADLLVKTANDNGGVDNITVELVEFTMSPQDNNVIKKRNLKIPIISAVSIIVMGLCLGLYFSLNGTKSTYIRLNDIYYKQGQVAYCINGRTLFSPLTGDSIDVGFVADSIDTNLEISTHENAMLLKFPAQMMRQDSIKITLYKEDSCYCLAAFIKWNNASSDIVVLQTYYPSETTNKKIATLNVRSDELRIDLDYVKPSKYVKSQYRFFGRIDSLIIETDSASNINDSVYVVLFNARTSYKDDCIKMSFICNDTIRKYVIPVDITKRNKMKPRSRQQKEAGNSTTKEKNDTVKIDTIRLQENRILDSVIVRSDRDTLDIQIHDTALDLTEKKDSLYTK